MKSYSFHWKPELVFAIGTFLITMGMAFIAQGDSPVNDWDGWLMASAAAAARTTLAAVLPRLTTLLGRLSPIGGASG